MTQKLVPAKADLNKQLKAAIRKIDKELKTLGASDAPSLEYKSNGTSFKYNELDSNTVNIHNNVDLVYLGKALAKMLRVEKEYNETMQSSGLNSFPACVWCGHFIQNWIHDLKIRVALVGNGKRITELRVSRLELEKFLSTEDRLFTVLENLKDIL